MLTATGNNFGDSIIQLKDYQSDKMVILNGRFQLPTENEEYQAAEQLEIYVPDLSIPKSTMTAVFQHGFSSDKVYLTALKSWIKNKNTIVIEKPFILRRAENEPELDFFCAYVPKGVRFDIDALQPTPLTIENSTLPNLAITYQQCFVTENWVFLAIQITGAKAENEGDAFSFRLNGFPSGFSANIPFFFNSSTYGIDGSFEAPFTIIGNQFKCFGLTGVHYRESYRMETRVFIVK